MAKLRDATSPWPSKSAALRAQPLPRAGDRGATPTAGVGAGSAKQQRAAVGAGSAKQQRAAVTAAGVGSRPPWSARRCFNLAQGSSGYETADVGQQPTSAVEAVGRTGSDARCVAAGIAVEGSSEIATAVAATSARSARGISSVSAHICLARGNRTGPPLRCCASGSSHWRGVTWRRLASAVQTTRARVERISGPCRWRFSGAARTRLRQDTCSERAARGRTR